MIDILVVIKFLDKKKERLERKKVVVFFFSSGENFGNFGAFQNLRRNNFLLKECSLFVTMAIHFSNSFFRLRGLQNL